jgi:phytanoyl-CoA hydroxylase
MNDDFDAQGWGLIRGIVNENEINNILSLIQSYIDNNEKKMEIWDMNKTENGKLNSIHCLHMFDDTILEFFKTKKIFFETARQLLQSEVEIIAIEAFLKPAGYGKAVVIHQDNYLWCLEKGDALTIWIALDDIDEVNGGLKYYNGSHKCGLLEHEPSYKIGTSQTIKKEEYDKYKNCDIILNNLKAGDAQFHHSLTIHESDANNSTKSRRVITIQFKSINDKLDIERRKKYREEVLRQQYILKNTNETI